MLSGDQVFWLAAMAIGAGAVTLWVFIEYLGGRAKARTKLRQTEAREETKRELAAYVAEGSISPEDAATLIAAGSDGLDGFKAGLRDVFAKGAGACRSAGEKARKAGVRVEVVRDKPNARQEHCCESA